MINLKKLYKKCKYNRIKTKNYNKNNTKRNKSQVNN